MKRILTLIVLLTLCGCSYENTPMQAVVDRYKTDNIKHWPNGAQGTFLVKDTNGAVWYVETESSSLTTNSTYRYECVRNTLLFEATVKKIDKIKLED